MLSSVIIMTIFKLKVKDRDPKQVGPFLLKNGFSRQALSKAKHHGGAIYVNHQRRYTSYHLKEGDQVLFLTGKEKKNPWLKTSFRPLTIVKETKNYLIVNKEAGVLSIPSRYEDDAALVNRALGYFETQGDSSSKPHVITRLDRNTSGLVLIGKNAVAHARFSHLNKENFVKKYHAIVHGNFSSSQLTGLIDQPIGKAGASVKRMVKKEGKRALTAYQVLDQVPGASLLALKLLTGRTHQIRVHLSFLGHPLYGDALYGACDQFSRQALNCYFLTFLDPFAGDKRIQLRIKDPADMRQLWHRLAGTAVNG